MTAEEQDLQAGCGLRRARGMEGIPVLKGNGGFLLVSRGMRRAGASRAARALFRDGSKTLLLAVALPHPAHHAMMPAVSATAGGQIGVVSGSGERRNQRPIEEHQQRDGEGAAHEPVT